MADYKGNYYSTDAYNPTYKAKESGFMKVKRVTADDVTATRCKIGSGYIDEVETVITHAIIYRIGAGSTIIALPTNYTIEQGAVEPDGTFSLYIKGNANYTLNAGDAIVFYNQAVLIDDVL